MRQSYPVSPLRAINPRHSHRTRAPLHAAKVPERDRMKKEMLINVKQPEECRIAIVEDGVLEELYVERTSHESYTGQHLQRTHRQPRAGDPGRVRRFLGRPQRLPPRLGRRISVLRSRRCRPGAIRIRRPRERERRRDPRREGDRGRGREPRRRPPAPEPVDPSFGPPTSRATAHRRSLPGKATRPAARSASETAIARASGNAPISPSRAAAIAPSRGPRRFGEGLVSQPEPWPEPEPDLPVEPVTLAGRAPFRAGRLRARRVETPETRAAAWPEALDDWAEDRDRRSSPPMSLPPAGRRSALASPSRRSRSSRKRI